MPSGGGAQTIKAVSTMRNSPQYVPIPLSVPPEHDKRLHDLAENRGIEVGQMLREWIADELVRWIPDEAPTIQRSPSFREIRFGAALRELSHIQNEYGPDVPGLRRCIKQVREAINKARAQMKTSSPEPTEDEPY
jgi:hypothetical protein